MRKRRLCRSLALCVLVAALGFALVQEPVFASEAAQISIQGELEIFSGTLPAVWSYDSTQKKILIDVQAEGDLHTWGLLDWSGARPTAYIGREDGCFSFPIEQRTFPDPGQLQHLLQAPAHDAAQLGDPAEIPEGLTSVRDRGKGETFLVLKETDALLVFRARSVSPVEHLPSLAKDTSRCQPLSVLVATLKGSTKRQALPADQATAAQSSLLQYNHPYTFRGSIYGDLTYKGTVFSQTKPEYDAALKTCTDAGSNVCKPYWEVGGLFGRYGYHCGDGWGSGNQRVSGQDYCCHLHDLETWGKDPAKNLCGFAACMTCKYYTSLPDWEQNFRGDFWAQKAIAAFVAGGLPFILCYPQSYLTGFTCN